MSKDCTVQELIENRSSYTVMDVRSPGEFAEAHIPGAINIPLFTNDERAEIGTIYKQKGQSVAKWRAMEIVSPKLPVILGKMKEIVDAGQKPMLYCWRGGMRSQSVGLFATMAGLDVYRIIGGYRAYREYIVEEIPKLIPNHCVVITGMTGTGKTDILEQLTGAGFPVLDLEKYANHKGSVFGAISGEVPHNQKMFDALLFNDLYALKDSPYFIMEGESKRVGHAVQPDELLEKKLKGLHITVQASLATRIKRIYEQYILPNENDPAFHDRVEYAMRMILKRVKGTELHGEFTRLMAERNYRKLAELLMVDYYDPRYGNKTQEYENPEIFVSADSVLLATEEIAGIIEQARTNRFERVKEQM